MGDHLDPDPGGKKSIGKPGIRSEDELAEQK